MPKHSANSGVVAKPRARSKSTVRKPLRDVYNSGRDPSKSTSKKLPVNYEEDNEQQHPNVGNNNAALDRLLLIHSDLSALIRQVDELVVEALKFTSNNGMKEVESFADFLSQMQTSLKPWVPRFQTALSAEPASQLEQAVVGWEDESMKGDISHVVESPEQSKWGSLVSSSPLVSWRTGCTTEGGRQLFLLTPLPQQRAVSVDNQEPFKSAMDIGASISVGQQPVILDAVGGTNSDLLAGAVVTQTPIKVSDTPLESKCVSPRNLFRRDGCMLVMTPCLKVSPPKSCVLLEPVAEFQRKSDLGVHQSTPFLTRIQNSDESQDTESSNFQSLQKMTLICPQLLGIQLGNNYGNRRKVVEESPNWLMSPPKTCVLMEPPDENLQTDGPCENPLLRVGSNLHHEANLFSTNRNDIQDVHSLANTMRKQEFCSSFSIIESTPMPGEPDSTIRLGKHPGENTLKKELWKKYEAASISGVHFNNGFTIGKSSTKGFLERLDEVF